MLLHKSNISLKFGVSYTDDRSIIMDQLRISYAHIYIYTYAGTILSFHQPTDRYSLCLDALLLVGVVLESALAVHTATPFAVDHRIAARTIMFSWESGIDIITTVL